MCCLRTDLWKRSFNPKDFRLVFKMLCPKSRTFVPSGYRNLPPASAPHLLSHQPLRGTTHAQTHWPLTGGYCRAEHGAAAAEIVSSLRPKSIWSDVTLLNVPLQQSVNHSERLITEQLCWCFCGNTCAPPQIFLINDHSGVRSQSPSWYPQKTHSILRNNRS